MERWRAQSDADGASDGSPPDAPNEEFLTSEYAQIVRRETLTPLKRPLPSLSRVLHNREMGRGPKGPGARTNIMQRWIPAGESTEVERMDARAYNGQWARDGELFVASFQNNVIRVYDGESWRVRKQLHAKYVRWTTTDVDVNREGSALLYSSITPVIHLCRLGSDQSDVHEALDMSGASEEGPSFGLWSCKFNADCSEVIAGSSDSSIYVYDLRRRAAVLAVDGHADDVNSVAWADRDSQIMYSASDDCTAKVWDRRALGRGNRPAGVLVGHTEGLTHVSSRGDGRYLITNSKDQTIKLWDVRMMADADAFARQPPLPRRFNWDYRWMDYPGRGMRVKHPRDSAVQTFRGHSVLQTLIRAHFSPAATTGQRYIATGSHDGSVYVYDTLGDPEAPLRLGAHEAAVRDVAWHPRLPALVTASWDGSLQLFEDLRPAQGPRLAEGGPARCPTPQRSGGPGADPPASPGRSASLTRLLASSLLRSLGAG